MKDTFSTESSAPQFDQEQEIHLRDYLRVILKRKLIILTFLAITFLTVFIATYTATPYYIASSQVLIERNYISNSLDNSRIRWDPEFLNTQFQIIRSVNVTRRVVKQLQLDTKYKHYFFEPPQKGLRTYLSSLKQGVKNILSGLFSFLSSENVENTEDTTTVLENDPLLAVAVEPMTDADIIARMILGGLSISPIPETKTIYIVYASKHPAMAKLIVNAVVQAYMDELLEIKLATSSHSLQWMTRKADEERKKLETSEIALQQYKRDNDLVTVENKLAIYPQKLAEFSSQLSKAQAEQKEYEAVYAQIKSTGTNYQDIETIPLFASNKVLQGLRDKIFKAEQQLKDLSKKYGYKHPTMINATGERDQLLKEKQLEADRIIESTRNSYELSKSREKNINQLLANTKQEILNSNERFMQYSIMKREVDMNRVLYDALTSSIKKASVTEQSQDVNVWVVNKAEMPGSPAKPRKKRNLTLGLILGLFGGIGLAFFIEYLDNTINDATDLKQRFNLTVLGTVKELKDKSEKIETYLLKNPLSPMAESYRLIRSGLLLSTPDHAPRSILVTSMSPQEGKTSTTTNLARILAQNNKKVLIIDCDMRRPRMHSMFATPNSYGLSNYLTSTAGKNLLKSVPGENISLLPAGPTPPNPAELLISDRMKSLIEKMLEKYDFVLLDSPPVQSVTDSLTLSQLVDGTLLVIRSGKTTHDMLESGLKKLHDVRSNILGVIINGVKQSLGDSATQGYYDYYSKEIER